MLKITLNKGQKIFFTSDTHFGHKNICRGVSDWRIINPSTGEKEVPISTTRPFSTLEEMNEHLLHRINVNVGQDDVLIHLGDFSFGGFDNISRFRDRIVCKNLHIVTGNHDHHIVRNRDNIRSIFSSVHEFYTQLDLRYPSIKTMGSVSNINMILSHFPICSWENMNKGWFHLFGHVHLPPNKAVMKGRSMDVGVDGSGYDPYSLHDILSTLNGAPIKPTVLPSDHHVDEFKVTN